jgi:hypothetical protein
MKQAALLPIKTPIAPEEGHPRGPSAAVKPSPLPSCGKLERKTKQQKLLMPVRAHCRHRQEALAVTRLHRRRQYRPGSYALREAPQFQ